MEDIGLTPYALRLTPYALRLVKTVAHKYILTALSDFLDKAFLFAKNKTSEEV
jgi:hypothetical protein